MMARFAAKAAVLITSLSVTLLAAEAVYGLYLFKSEGKEGKTYYEFRDEKLKATSYRYPFFVFDRDLGYRITPNQNVKLPEPKGLPNAPRRKMFYDLETNSHGFRYAGELRPSKPPGEVRVFSLGGSTTFGAEVPNPWTYPTQLGALIGDASIKVVNAGVGGYRSIHILEYYRRVIRPLHPDVVTLYEGWNDYEDFMMGYWAPQDVSGHALTTQLDLEQSRLSQSALGHLFLTNYYEYKNYNRREIIASTADAAKQYQLAAERSEWVDEFRTNFSRLVDEIRRDSATPILVIPATPVFPGAPREAKEFADNDLNMTGRFDALVIAHGKIQRTLEEIAKEKSVTLVNANEPFTRLNGDYRAKYQLFVDRMHLTREGNHLIAQTLEPSVRAAARERPGRAPH